MVISIPTTMQESLIKYAQGASWVQHAFLRTDDTSDVIIDAVNGEFDPDIPKYYAICFQHSFDEEAAELNLFVEELLGEAVRYNAPKEATTSLSALVNGLDLMIESLKEIAALCKADDKVNQEVTYFVNSNGYHPFKERGPAQLKRSLNVFRRTLVSVLKEELGSKQYRFFLTYEDNSRVG